MGKDYWQRLKSYIQQQTGSEFNHGMCPGCFETQRPKFKVRELMCASDEVVLGVLLQWPSVTGSRHRAVEKNGKALKER